MRLLLGVVAPDRSFPRLNEAKEMRRRLLGLTAFWATAPVLVMVVSVIATAFLVWRVFRSRQR